MPINSHLLYIYDYVIIKVKIYAFAKEQLNFFNLVTIKAFTITTFKVYISKT